MKPKKKPKPSRNLLPIADLLLDGETQTRLSIDQPTVDQYVGVLENGGDLPEPEVYGPDEAAKFWIADGFHRLIARRTLGETVAACAVRPGGYREALAHSLSANDQHGLRRSAGDKENAVRMALAEWPDLSTAGLADICAVGRELVERIRATLPRVRPSQARAVADDVADTMAAPPTVTGLDGKSYPSRLDRETLARRKAETAAETASPDHYEIAAHLWDGEARGALAPFSPFVRLSDRPLPEEIRSEVDYRGIPTWAELLIGRGVLPVTVAHADAPDSAPDFLIDRRFAIDAIQTMEPPLKLFRTKPISPRQAEKLVEGKARAEEDALRRKWLHDFRRAVEARLGGKALVPPFYAPILKGIIFALASAHPLALEWVLEEYRADAGENLDEAATPGENLVAIAPHLLSPALIGLLNVCGIAYDLRTNGFAGVLVAAAIRTYAVPVPSPTSNPEETPAP